MNNLPVEEWRVVPSVPSLEASSHGRVRVIPFVGTMPYGGARNYGGYEYFGNLRKSSRDARHMYFATVVKGKNVKIHFAVCEAFNGKNPSGLSGVRHLNENSLDNRPANLCWDDQKTNMNDPNIKSFHSRRVSPKSGDTRSKREKRYGIYDSIEDIGLMQRELRARRAANDNGIILTEKAA